MKLIFLHIPKAGGTTFHHILERIYKNQIFFDIKVKGNRLAVEEFTDMPERQRQRIDILKGHMPFGLHRFFDDGEEVKYITLFRNPVDRIVSHYDYLLRKPRHYLYEQVKGKNMSLLDYALSDLNKELDNDMCRVLLEDPDIKINALTEEHYNLALGNLKKHFIAFGLMEEFDKSLLLFRQALNWDSYPYYVKLNTRPLNSENRIGNEIREEIAQRNKWDVRLYDWVQKEFATNVARIADLDLELKILHASSQAYSEGIAFGQLNSGKSASNDLVKSTIKRILNPLRRYLS